MTEHVECKYGVEWSGRNTV